jgi:hypothetical protein
MISSEKIEFFIVLFNKTSYSESSNDSAELKVVIPGKETRKGQG